MNEFSPERILLATDGSDDASLAARAAVDLSNRGRAELHVVHAWRPMPHYAYPSLAPERYHPPYEEGARKILAEQIRHIEEAGGTLVEAHLVLGRPAETIVDLAEDLGAGLIVVGSCGLGWVRRHLLGSVSEGVVHHARCPVLVVRGGDGSWPPDRVIVGDDGSDDARRAGAIAAQIAGLFAAEMVLVRAYENPPEPVGGWSGEDRRELDEALFREERILDGRAEELEAVAGSRPVCRLVETEPTLAMLLAAEEGQEESTLLAVGSRGLGMAERTVLGSVSTKVLRVARGPVLVCPREERTEA